MTTEVSEIGAATQIVSCGTPLPGLTLKIVDPEQHVALEPGRCRRDLDRRKREVPGVLE